MIEVIKAFGFTGFGMLLGWMYARHGWVKYYEGQKSHDEARGRGSR